jgi:ubiquinone biosynthesis protein COQ9
MESSTLSYRETVEKKGKIKIKEIRFSTDESVDLNHYTSKDFSTFKFLLFLVALLGVIWLYVSYTQNDNSETPSTNISQEDKQNSESRSIFDKPAQQFLRPSGINSLIAVWNIPLNDGSGPRSLGEVSDDILIYLNANARTSGEPTRSDLLISLQPGNSLHSITSRLFTSDNVIKLVTQRWLSSLPE